MEKTEAGTVAALDLVWSDAGTWDEIWRATSKDGSGNAASGNTRLYEARNCLVSSDGPLTVVAGLDGIVVINTGSAILVTTLANAQNLKPLVEGLQPPATAPNLLPQD
jgi:mannose-1-phosphate guanylyltransferase